MNWILPDVDEYVVVKIAWIWVHQLTQLIILKEKPRERSEEIQCLGFLLVGK